MTRINARKTAVMLIFAVTEGRLTEYGEQSPYYSATLENVLDDFFEPLYFASLKAEAEVFSAYPNAKTLEYIYALVSGTVSRIAEIDGAISAHLMAGWRIERVSAAARACMRAAIAELLLNLPDSPPAVVVNEAIQIARELDGEQSVPFVNGVLGAVLRERGEENA